MRNEEGLTVRVRAKTASIAIPVILTVCVEMVLLTMCGASALFWQEGAISLVILTITIACNLKATELSPVFGLPLGAASIIVLLLQLLINTIIVIARPTDQPNRIGFILGLGLLTLMVILAATALFSSNHAQPVEEENEARTDTLQEIRIRLDALAASTSSDQRALVQKTAEAARYASPISNERTEQVDSELLAAIDQLEHSLVTQDDSSARATCDKIISLIAGRDSLAQRR